jgi:hypothetical protein
VEPGDYCARLDTMFNMPGVHVLDPPGETAAARLRLGFG